MRKGNRKYKPIESKRKERQCVHNKQIQTNNCIEHPPNIPTTTVMRDRQV